MELNCRKLFDKQAALDVSYYDVGPLRDRQLGVEWDGEPLLAPGPDAARVVLAPDLLCHQGGVTDHSLDTIQHNSTLFSAR